MNQSQALRLLCSYHEAKQNGCPRQARALLNTICNIYGIAVCPPTDLVIGGSRLLGPGHGTKTETELRLVWSAKTPASGGRMRVVS
jgi:hypothetical protein